MKTSFQEFIQFYKANNPLNSHGRLGRLDMIFWSFYAPFLLIIVPFITYSTITFILVEAGGSAAQNILNYVLFIFGVMVIICVVLMGWGSNIRRLHDLNLSGTWLLLDFVPLVNIFFVIYSLFAPGTKGENTYGLPYQTPKWERITLISCILIQVITIVIFIVVGGLLGQNDESTNNRKEETTIATTEKIVNWSPYKAKEGSFQIDFPNNKVDFDSSTEKIDDKGTITSLSYVSDLGDNIYGAIEYSTENFAIDGEKIGAFPPLVIEGILGVKIADQKSENKTTSEFEIHRISGKQAKFEYKQNLIFNDKAYIIEGIILSTNEKKIYNIYMLYPTISNDVETKRFFDSFKILSE